MSTKVKSGTKGKGKSATGASATGASAIGASATGASAIGASANFKPNQIVSNKELPETDDMEIYKMIDIDTIETFIEDIYKNYTYTIKGAI